MSTLARSATGFDPGPARRRVPWELLGGVLIAVLGHLVLFGILSLAWRAPPVLPPEARAIDVSLVDDVALDQRAPPATEAPAQSRAPELAPPEDAPPPAPAEAEQADPTPPVPQPKAVPPPKPAPKAAPAPKQPAAEKPAKPEKVKPAPAAKPAATPGKAVAVATKATGTNPKATRTKPTGSLLDADFRKGLAQAPSPSKAVVPPAATMDGKAAADIGAAILRQVQPCANQQVNPGPGASRIVVTVQLHINRDGSLSQRPEIIGADGLDDENDRYVDAVKRNAVATFMGCAPLRGLPPDLYEVRRGWRLFRLKYHLP